MPAIQIADRNVRAPRPERPEASDYADLSIRDLARMLLDRHDGMKDPAKEEFIAILNENDSLFDKLISDVMDESAEASVRTQMLATRRAIIASANASANANGRARVASLASGIRHSLLDLPLSSGRKLRDAERDEVDAQATRFELMSSTMMHQARFLRRIIGMVPAGVTVGEVISEARAASLWKEVA